MHGHRPSPFAAAAALVVVSAAPAVSAFPDKPARLVYERLPSAAACPDEEAFRVYLEFVRHGRDNEFLPPDPTDKSTPVVRITLSRVGGKYRGVLKHEPPPGTPAQPPEEKVNSECEDLVRDLAFPAAFFLPWSEDEHHKHENEEPPPRPACPACPTCPAPQPPVFVCDPRRKGDPANDKACKSLLSELKIVYGDRVDPQFWLSAGGLLTLAYTSDPGGGFSLGADVRAKHWSVGLEAQVTLPAFVRLGEQAGVPLGFDISTFVGMVVPCARFGETVQFVGCGAIGAGGMLTYDSLSVKDPSRLDLTIRLGPRAGVEVPFADRFAFYTYGEVSFAPLIRSGGFVTGERWVQSAASVFLGAGFSVRLSE